MSERAENAARAKFAAACNQAFDEMIVLARRLRPRSEAPDAVLEYARGICEIGIAAGFTRDEVAYYGERVWLMVQAEHHA